MAQTNSVNLAPALPYLIDMLRNAKGNAQNEQYLSGQDVEGSWFVDPERTLKLQQKVLDSRQQQEAVPFLQRLAEVKDAGMDPEAEWQQAAMDELKELQAYNATKAPNNQYVTAGGQQAAQGLQGAITTADVAEKLQNGDFVPGMTLARVLDQKDGTTALDRLRELAKQNDGMRQTRGDQAWINAAAGATDDPKLQALLAAGQYGVTPDKVKNLASTLGLDPVTLTTVEAGDAAGNDVKYVFNPRTGQTQGVVGKPQQAGRNATRITNNLMAGEKAFQAGVGATNAKLVGQANEEAAALQDTKAMLQELSKLNSMYKTGRAAVATQRANELLDYVGLADSKKLTWAQKYDALAERIVLQIGGTALKGSQTEREWDLVRKTAAGMKNKPEANKYIITQGMKVIQRAEDRARRAAKATTENPYNPAMGLEIAVPEQVAAPPATAQDYLKKWR